MLHRLLKCEYRHWSTAPWFFSLVFSAIFGGTILSMRAEEYLSSIFVWFLYPMIVLLGSIISCTNYQRERETGGILSTLTMPVSRSEFQTSKFISVYLGQIMFAAITGAVLSMILTMKTPSLIWICVNAFFYAFALVALGGGINLLFVLQRKDHYIYIVAVILLVIFHVPYNFMIKFPNQFLSQQIQNYSLIALLIIVISLVLVWLASGRYLKNLEEII